MADGIKISTQTLVDTAQKVRNINVTLEGKLDDIRQAINALESDWQSDAGKDIRTAINAMKTRFEEYKNVVESYAKFLDETAQNYEKVESAIQSNASAFK